MGQIFNKESFPSCIFYPKDFGRKRVPFITETISTSQSIPDEPKGKKLWEINLVHLGEPYLYLVCEALDPRDSYFKKHPEKRDKKIPSEKWALLRVGFAEYEEYSPASRRPWKPQTWHRIIRGQLSCVMEGNRLDFAFTKEELVERGSKNCPDLPKILARQFPGMPAQPA